MNDNVIQFPQPKEGDLTFFMCGCNPQEPHAFLPVVVIAEKPIVAGFVCPACDANMEVVNGIVQPATYACRPNG